jgi:hypothetical protein
MIKEVKISLSEQRTIDAWFDFSRRELREGPVYFYKVKDFYTGEWLFKVCVEKEFQKIIVKALKCPPGRLYAQFEGDTMLFQRSVREGFFYDVISLTYFDEKNRIRRKLISQMEEIPEIISKNFEIIKHKDAAGKDTPLANQYVTLTRSDDYRSCVLLFLLERVWPLKPSSPEAEFKELKERKEKKASEVATKSFLRNILSIIKVCEKARDDEVYTQVREKLRINKIEFDKILNDMEEQNIIFRPEPGYIKLRKTS